MSRQLARKSLLSFSIKISGAVFGFISLYFVKINMGFEAVGMLAFATSIMTFFTVFGDLGFTTAHLKRRGDNLDVSKCNGTIISIKLLLTLLMGIIVLLWVALQKYFFGYEFESRDLEIIVYIVVFQYLILNIDGGFRTVFMGNIETAKAQIPRFFGRFSVMLIKIGVALFGASVIYLALAELFGALVLLSFSLFFIRDYRISKPDRKYLKLYSSFALPLVFVGYVSVLSQNLDRVMIGYFLSVRDVGIYSIPLSLTQVLLLVSTTINYILIVPFSDHYNKKEFTEIQRLTHLAEKHISLILLPLVIFIFIFAEFILGFFGDDTTPSVSILKILVLATYINATMRPYDAQFVSAGKLKLAFSLGLIVLSTNLILNIIFIPKTFLEINLLGLGAEGAALALIISFIIQSLLARYFVYQTTYTRQNMRLLFHFLAALITYFVVLHIYSLVQVTIVSSVFYILLVPILFYGILFLSADFSSKEINFFISIVNPRKMKSYIFKELQVNSKNDD